jgi:hypothetical protein
MGHPNPDYENQTRLLTSTSTYLHTEYHVRTCYREVSYISTRTYEYGYVGMDDGSLPESRTVQIKKA